MRCHLLGVLWPHKVTRSQAHCLNCPALVPGHWTVPTPASGGPSSLFLGPSHQKLEEGEEGKAGMCLQTPQLQESTNQVSPLHTTEFGLVGPSPLHEKLV